MPRHKQFDAISDRLDSKNMALSDFGEPQPIEIVATDRIKDAMDLEAFMHEELVIILPRSPVKGTLAIECISVNGRNMPIVRGMKTRIKRLFVEALAQSVAFDYEQRQGNPSDLSDIITTQIPTMAYPFSVLEDPSGERGTAWLEGVIANNQC